MALFIIKEFTRTRRTKFYIKKKYINMTLNLTIIKITETTIGKVLKTH